MKAHHVPALDGLRGVLALLVLFFHTGLPLVPGGGHGVDMFFVLSGFLITGLLKDEMESCGKVDYREFWRRRLKRLMPALIALTFVYVVVAPWVYPVDVAAWRWRDLLAALTFTYNWDLIAQPRLTGLGHMWSLGVEGQFYLLWPFVIARIHQWGRYTCPFLIALFVGLTALRVAGFFLLTDHDAVLSSLPGRASGLVLGAALAYAPRFSEKLGLLGLVGMTSFVILTNRNDHFAGELWAISIAELSTVALICGLTQPCGLSKLFSSPVLVRLGAISYGVYIWHFPFQRATFARGWLLSSGLTLSGALLFATVSFFFIERRRRGRQLAPAAPIGRPLQTFDTIS